MEGVDEVWMFILSPENILLVSASELNLKQGKNCQISRKKCLWCYHLVIVVQEIDLVRIAGVRVREEEIVRSQTDRIQAKLCPLLTDPLYQFSDCEKE